MDCLMTKLALTLALLFSSVSQAGVYVSYDSMLPTTENQLRQAEIQNTREQTEALIRNAQNNEYMMSQLIEFQKAQSKLANEKMDNVVEQRALVESQRNLLLADNKLLQREKNALEQERMALYKDYANRKSAFLAQTAQTQSAIYEEQNRRAKEFHGQQEAARADLLALQKRVALSQDDLLVAQLKKDAPSNVMIVSSKDASNVKAKVKDGQFDQLGTLGETQSQQPLVDMNTFIREILPNDWSYNAPLNSQNKFISIVQGKDWKSIINQIGIEHPYIEFFIDVYEKNLTARIMQHSQAPVKNDATRAWQIDRTLSLKETIEKFAKETGWQVIWDTQNVNYPIVASAVITANFAGRNGVINQLMKGTQRKEFPLVAHWKLKNNVVVITRRGSKKL